MNSVMIPLWGGLDFRVCGRSGGSECYRILFIKMWLLILVSVVLVLIIVLRVCYVLESVEY